MNFTPGYDLVATRSPLTSRVVIGNVADAVSIFATAILKTEAVCNSEASETLAISTRRRDLRAELASRVKA